MNTDSVLVCISERGTWAGTFGNVLIYCLRQPPNLQQMDLLDARQRELARAYPGGYALLSVVVDPKSQIRPIRDDVRRRIAETTRELAQHRVAIARVVLGSGFFAAAARGIVAGLALLGSPARQHKNFDAIAPAAYWLAPLAAQTLRLPLSAAELIAVAERGRLHTEAP